MSRPEYGTLAYEWKYNRSDLLTKVTGISLIGMMIVMGMIGCVLQVNENTNLIGEGVAYKQKWLQSIEEAIVQESESDEPNFQAMLLLQALKTDVSNMSNKDLGKRSRDHKGE